MSFKDRILLLSLQDACMLQIMLHLEEFPIEILSLLPVRIRSKLLYGLSYADILHLENTAVFTDVRPRADWSLDELSGKDRVCAAREFLLKPLLYNECFSLAKLFCLHLTETLSLFNRFEGICYVRESSLLKHIRQCYRSLDRTASPIVQVESFWLCCKGQYLYPNILLPTRFLKYILDQGTDQHGRLTRDTPSVCFTQMDSGLVESLLQYCMLTAPAILSINTFRFVHSVFWKEYQEKRQSTLANSSKVMAPIIPFMQVFLSTVETLELCPYRCIRDDCGDHCGEKAALVSYVLLCSLITSTQPHLKHLKLRGESTLIYWVLSTVAELFYTITESWCVKSDTTASPNPYLLDGLSVSITDEGIHGRPVCATKGIASTIASTIATIVLFQCRNLKDVAIDGIGFCFGTDRLGYSSWHQQYDPFDDSSSDSCDINKGTVSVPEYRALISFILPYLLKQPQLRSLSVGRTPLPAAIELIETFLSTPATHEQSLSIVCVEGKDVWMSEWLKDLDDVWVAPMTLSGTKSPSKLPPGLRFPETSVRFKQKPARPSDQDDVCLAPPPIPVPHVPSPGFSAFPETNAQFKCLDIKCSSHSVHTWLFNLAEKKLLKTLKIEMNEVATMPQPTFRVFSHCRPRSEKFFVPTI